MQKLILGLCIVAGVMVYLYLQKSEISPFIGAREVVDIAKSEGKFFISPDGNGTECSKSMPCGFESLDLFKGFLKNRIEPGDVIFFRKGTYHYSRDGVTRVYLTGGSKAKPVIYQSYPGEVAVFDGSQISLVSNKEDWREGRLELRDNHIILRKVEVQNMPQHGVTIYGNHNIVEGCKIHDNHLSGVAIANLVDGYSVKDTAGSYNIVRDNIIYANSDVGLNHGNYGNGDNADGISIMSGVSNRISHNFVYGNSDDGIDSWKSMNTLVEFNRVHGNGKGAKGNGNGIKLGGDTKESPLGANAIAQFNICSFNKHIGININAGKNVIMAYNTVYASEDYGFTVEEDTIIKNNISFKNKTGDVGWAEAKEQKDNSWQLGITFTESDFVSLDYTSREFLQPVNITAPVGAYVDVNRSN